MPRLAVALGDPSGIGCEVIIKAINSSSVKRLCTPIIFGDAGFAGYFKNVEFISSSDIINNKYPLKIGVPSKKSGIIAIAAVKKAVKYCTSNKILALVTGPVSKESLKFAGLKYAGHTELLAALTKSKKIAMLMALGKIHCVMITRHIPISKISENLNTKNIVETVNLSVDFIKKTYKKNIKVVLCGLNPHAGDNSILGQEEKKIILPAYKILKKSNINITRPISADIAWLKTTNGQFDLICAMYHDQIMIPLKCINASKIVNITAGLPFIRTSPGHGTAFDIAGKNKADPSAMIEAILYAARYIKILNIRN